MPDDSLASPKDLARTYNSRSYADPWELVEDYWRVVDYAARNTTLGSSALASRLDLPRSRIRPWVRKPDAERKPSRPDPVRAIQVAEGHNWIPARYDSKTFPALSQAVAWIFSGGSIDTERFVPLFTVGGESDLADLDALLEELGVGCTVCREAENSRGAEYRPAQDASVLGRVLSLLGAPTGTKNADAAITLPAYLEGAPESIRREFIDVYLRNRGHRYDHKATIHFREERSTDYLDALAALIADVSGERVTRSDRNVIVSADAVRALAV
ncbi:hypothetical protein HAPAU_34920 [Halalkalicoccus paucihalophilus]|uniref:DOD-type homing endonuclease domain-containing protein n=1 Tax=Halalkalicoccus paucihalophilus TaxID=1008153 RepID=A0A151AA62_9EURY|nr:hypothetical protein [Halalkalicoccus paucihalophilus]KYH24509.1 hypothetical protein HAPAU_34920 [Halalkalicoccus paucihalophilus]